MDTNGKVTFSIVDGPSKMDLLMGLAYAYDKSSPHRPIFCILVSYEQTKIKAPFIICGLRHEDGSGESFLIDVRLSSYLDRGYPNYGTSLAHTRETVLAEIGLTTDKSITGYYDTRTRKGYIVLEG